MFFLCVLSIIFDFKKPKSNRFIMVLSKDLLTGLWYEVGDKIVRDKVGQALRDGKKALRAGQSPTKLPLFPRESKLQKLDHGRPIRPNEGFSVSESSAFPIPTKLENLNNANSFGPSTKWPSELRAFPNLGTNQKQDHEQLFWTNGLASLSKLQSESRYNPQLRMEEPDDLSNLAYGIQSSQLPLPLAEARTNSVSPPREKRVGPTPIKETSEEAVGEPHSLEALSGVPLTMHSDSCKPTSVFPPGDTAHSLSQRSGRDLMSFLFNDEDSDGDDQRLMGDFPWTESDLTPNPVTYPSSAKRKGKSGDYKKED
jgi:hypothetical protein